MKNAMLRTALLSLALVLTLGGLVVLLKVRAAAPAQITLSTVGLPYAGTLALQHINELGLTTPTSTTVRFASPDGTPLQIITNPNLPPESLTLYTGPDDPYDTAWTWYPTSPEEGTRVYGVSYQTGVSGNSAYLGMDYATATSVAQPSAFELYRVWMMFQVKSVAGWSSGFVLQNRSTDFMATLSLIFFDADGFIICSEVANLPAGGSRAYDLAALDCLPAGYTGSAVAESDQPLAVGAARLVYQPAHLACDYQGINLEQMSTHLVAPALFKDYDLQASSLCIWNTGIAPTIVRVRYSDGLPREQAVAANAVWCLDQGLEAHAAGWAGAAEISADQPLGAVVRVLAGSDSAPVGCWAYTATPSRVMARAQGTGLALPLILNDGDWGTRTYLYNEGDTPVTVEQRFVSSSGRVYCTGAVDIAAHSLRILETADLPPRMQSGMAYFNANGPVAGAVGMTSKQPAGTTDRHMGYRAAYGSGPFAMPATCTSLSSIMLPLVVKP